MRYLLIFLLTLGVVFAKELQKDCYQISYLFFNVARSCISYETTDKNIKTAVSAYTVGFLKLLKDIKYEGKAISDIRFNSEKFYFFKKEKSFIEIHDYFFDKNWIYFKKVIIKGANEKVIKKKIENKNFTDPLTATLYYYKQILNNKPIEKRIFFNGKDYYVPYEKRKKLQINNKEVIYVEINPTKINIGGILQPTGIWKLWIDARKPRLYKAEIKIKVGTVKIVLENN
ncbi:DUF3108 domain-containing protein [Persephonella sp. IF05-L8]|uniref:DUF3108 domain-containing protein n=1 Tax=Persephonella sp. IF05-L8 TaxID=1158338 RepID=UPI0004980514